VRSRSVLGAVAGPLFLQQKRNHAPESPPVRDQFLTKDEETESTPEGPTTEGMIDDRI
jgi:hypothetical protein